MARDEGMERRPAVANGADGERAARILDQMRDAHMRLDHEFRIVALNAAAERLIGVPREALLGRTHWEAFPASVGTDAERHYRRVQAGGGEAHFAQHYVGEGHDRHVEVDAYATEDGGVALYWREVSARVLAEEALRESLERYQALFESLDSGFCVLEMIFDDAGRPVDYRFVEANPAFVAQTGLVDAVGRTARELVPALESHWIEIYGQVARTGEPMRFQNGSEAMGRWFDVYAFRVGRPQDARVALLFTDVTAAATAQRERDRLLAALEVERSRLAYVFQQAPAFLAVVRGPEHVFELANDAYYQLVGHRTLVGRPVREALPEVLDQGFTQLLDSVLATGEPVVGREVSVRLARAHGEPEERFVDFVYLPLVEADGARSGVIAHGTDVTEHVLARREAERQRQAADAARAEAEAARVRAERLQKLTAALAGARTADDVATVVVADMVVALGARTGALAGRAPEGDALVLLRTVGFPEPVAAVVRRQSLDYRSPLVDSFRGQRPIWIESRDGPDGLDARWPAIAPLWDALGTRSGAFVPLVAAGEVVGVISFAFEQARSFTVAERTFLATLGQQAALAIERARLFEAERAARQEAEAANRAKSEFLAVMSHELRTPLNAIGGYAELMEMGIRGPVTAQQREDLGRIQASQRHLLGLINEVLNYARLETGIVHYDVETVPLREALAAAEALVSPQARAKGLALVVGDCPPALAVRADAEKLRQILVNLLSNAVKFTDAGGRVTLRCEPAEDAVCVQVRDTGIGIAPDKLQAVFEPFVQVRSDLTRPHEGTGLGLAISRDLARGMGGDLTAESAPGAGSTFTLSLPRA